MECKAFPYLVPTYPCRVAVRHYWQPLRHVWLIDEWSSSKKHRDLKDLLKSDANLGQNTALSEIVWMPKPLCQAKITRISRIFIKPTMRNGHVHSSS